MPAEVGCLADRGRRVPTTVVGPLACSAAKDVVCRHDSPALVAAPAALHVPQLLGAVLVARHDAKPVAALLALTRVAHAPRSRRMAAQAAATPRRAVHSTAGAAGSV
jgi:hypothetical protein